MVTRERRRTRRSILVAAGAVMAGCSVGYRGIPSSTRRDILDWYGDGLTARGAASEAWVEGNGAWEGNFFRAAASSWERADDRFATATEYFRDAETACRDVHATAAAEVCSRARRYCASMRASAAEHASAATAYADGRFDEGEEHLAAGFDHYLDALEHEVPRTATLEAALDGSR